MPSCAEPAARTLNKPCTLERGRLARKSYAQRELGYTKTAHIYSLARRSLSSSMPKRARTCDARVKRLCQASYSAARFSFFEICGNRCVQGSEVTASCKAVQAALVAAREAAKEVCGAEHVDNLPPSPHPLRTTAPGGRRHYLAANTATAKAEGELLAAQPKRPTVALRRDGRHLPKAAQIAAARAASSAAPPPPPPPAAS